jgi:hypothetical protein
VVKEVELEEKEDEYIQQLDVKEINEDKFQELIGELDLERAMGESVTEGPATMQATTQDEDVRESERDESVEEEPAAAAKAVESLTVGKGKRKAAPARANVYAEMDKPVSVLLKLSSICANTFAYSATGALRGRRSRSVSRLHMNGAARSARPARADALGGGRAARLSRAKSPSHTRGPGGSWCWRRMSRRAETRCRR